MKFVGRALSGFVLFAVTVALVGAGLWRLQSSMTADDSRKRRPAKERTYIVDTDTLQATTVKPTITAFGEVKAWRTLEVRAAAAGPITKISPNFRDGAGVRTNEMLFEIDPDTAKRLVTDAKAALLQAQAELNEANASLTSLKSDVGNTQTQLSLKRQDLARKKDLRERRLITQTLYDDAVLAVSTYEQNLATNRQALFAGNVRVEKAKNDIERAKLTLENAQRSLTDTSYNAPFSGRLTDVTATLGRRVSSNEKLGVLIDPAELEVAFTIPNSAFGRIVGWKNDHQIAQLPIKAELDLGERVISVPGVLDRSASVVDPNQGTRTLYARLKDLENSVLRPGDFVTVTIKEPALQNVAIVPSRAVTQDGKILIVSEDGRLKNVQAKIMRRQDDRLIIADVPMGQDYVKWRLPYLAEGVKVTPRGQEIEPSSSTSGGKGDMVSLTSERREVLIAMVKESKRMPEDRKKSILSKLNKPEAPRDLVERLEQRLQRRKGRS